MTVAKLWAELRSEGRGEPGWHLRRLGSQAGFELFAALRQPGSVPGLLLEIPAVDVPHDLELPESRGFGVEPQLAGPSHGGTARFTLWLRDPAYATIFPVLCEDVSSAAVGQPGSRLALQAWVGRLYAWQAFMARHGTDGLSEEAALGLHGELLVIEQDLASRIGLEAAIRSWVGPRSEPNDFELSTGFLEVKSTTRQAALQVQISSPDQLDDSRGRILLLHQRLRRDPGGLTLPGIVALLRRRAADEAPSAARLFEELLLLVGYLDAHAGQYIARYSRDTMRLFEVAGPFPRLRRGELRPGVLGCVYVINLGSYEALSAPAAALTELTGA